MPTVPTMPTLPTPPTIDATAVIDATRRWLERAVIGLDLCPFARAVHLKDGIRYAVSEATTVDVLDEDLERELLALQAADPRQIETTLLIHPAVLTDFLDYNDYLHAADRHLRVLDLVGEIQIASFHPQYRFTGTAPEDIENYTNRSPYPMLHLLRESSVERAIAAFPHTSRIPERNVATLRRLGHTGWRALWVD